MTTGVQFRGTVAANSTARWYTFNWPSTEYVLWTVVPDSVNTSGAEISWSVAVQLASTTAVTYWISITNVTGSPVDIEARYVIVA
jgi:hypothetical protein